MKIFLFVYTSIFSNVESILTKEIEAIPRKGSSKVHHGFQISLKLVDGTIVKQSNISSGMFKTMMLLSDLMFSSKNTVFLIDEIENSLGVNCLPDIIQEIKAANFQCVISTHHPKIINDISPSNWLIVHRDSGVIKTSKATDIENSSSHHDKFIQLINSCIFRDEK
ncbi:AAA family ATPase [Photobacterium angustum]|uniref:AAA family ATPase n=1 Tax=Photobacterium angustum TaxID=661 RepID=UPI0009BC1FF9|nr:AAA family ATPase [Photobacterium angustum]